MTIALNRADFDKVVRRNHAPRIARRESVALGFPGSLGQPKFRASVEELNAMVASVREWASAICWLSPNWSSPAMSGRPSGGRRTIHVALLLVIEVRDGRLASMCEFDLDDEEAAFAYAEERVRAATSRLAVSNRASDVADLIVEALRAHDVDAASSVLGPVRV